MRVDTSESVYVEHPQVAQDYSLSELRHMRFLMRRLQFLEAQVREADELAGGAIFAEKEVAALEWLLKEVGYLPEQNRERK